jgi:hypothetical protein
VPDSGGEFCHVPGRRARSMRTTTGVSRLDPSWPQLNHPNHPSIPSQVRAGRSTAERLESTR